MTMPPPRCWTGPLAITYAAGNTFPGTPNPAGNNGHGTPLSHGHGAPVNNTTSATTPAALSADHSRSHGLTFSLATIPSSPC